MRTTKVVNRNTGKVMEVDILSQSRFLIRVVAKGTNVPFTMTRSRETHRYGTVLADMPLETEDRVPMTSED